MLQSPQIPVCIQQRDTCSFISHKGVGKYLWRPVKGESRSKVSKHKTQLWASGKKKVISLKLCSKYILNRDNTSPLPQPTSEY